VVFASIMISTTAILSIKKGFDCIKNWPKSNGFSHLIEVSACVMCWAMLFRPV
jgi:hypothetical protein